MLLYASQFLGNKKDAEDIVQDVYVKVLERDGLVFEQEKVMKTYLFRSVRNASLDRLGKHDAMQFAIEFINQEVREESFVAFDENILVEIISQINLLPLKTRKVITEVFVSGKRYKEVADELGVSVNTVKTLLQRGMSSLRKHFKNQEEIFMFHILLLLT